MNHIYDVLTSTYAVVPLALAVALSLAMSWPAYRALGSPGPHRTFLATMPPVVAVIVSAQAFLAHIDRRQSWPSRIDASEIGAAGALYAAGIGLCLALILVGASWLVRRLSRVKESSTGGFQERKLVLFLLAGLLVALLVAAAGVSPLPGGAFFDRVLGPDMHPVRVALGLSGLFQATLLAGGGLLVLSSWGVFRGNQRAVLVNDLGERAVAIAGVISAVHVYGAFYRLFDPLPAAHLELALGLALTVVLIVGYLLLMVRVLAWIRDRRVASEFPTGHTSPALSEIPASST